MDMNYRGGMWEGGGWAGWSGVGGKWDNCNSIINKYIKKKKKKEAALDILKCSYSGTYASSRLCHISKLEKTLTGIF